MQGLTGTFDPTIPATGIVNAPFGIKLGSSTTTCNTANVNVLRVNATGDLERCTGNEWISGNAPPAATRTCKTIKDANAAATNGSYTLVAGKAFAATCDMTILGGGWTVIQTHVPGVPSQEGATALVGSNPGRWLQADLVQSLALASTQVLIKRTSGTLNANYAVSIASDPFVISQLRQLKMLNDHSQPNNNAVHWTTVGTVTAANMNYPGIATGNGSAYPSIYWASGNGSGLHVLSDMLGGTSTHGFINDSDGLEVLVR
jgi:hypothetical protein